MIDGTEFILPNTTEQNHTLRPNRKSVAKRAPNAKLAPGTMKKRNDAPNISQQKGLMGYDLESPGNEASIRFKFPDAEQNKDDNPFENESSL